MVDSILARSSAVTSEGIYFISGRRGNGQHGLCLLDPATLNLRVLALLEGPFQQGLTVSPDRKTTFCTRVKDANAELMLIERFR